MRVFHIIPNRRRLLAAAVAVVAATFVGAANDRDRDDEGRGDQGGQEPYTIALFGDMPYNALGRSQYPALLADINAARVAFSVFDGDLKAGGDGPCDEKLYDTAIKGFNSLDRPLIWVPGDNDWTDCWGRYGTATQPYYDPIDRLNLERALFTATDQSLGHRTLTLHRQSYEGGQYALYAENVRWRKGDVVYLGLNVQGSNDNYPYQDTDLETAGAPDRGDAERQRQRDEQGARRAANFQWLDEGFAYARQVRARGVMIIWQADPNFNNEQKQTNPHEWDAFPPYVDKLRSLVEGFSGQVALVHGDSHYFKIDKPLNHSTGGGVLTNFTRLETFGSRNTHWVSATIDPHDPNLFSFQPRIVRSNTE
jgi:hypothetical protein